MFAVNVVRCYVINANLYNLCRMRNVIKEKEKEFIELSESNHCHSIQTEQNQRRNHKH